jgi:phosphonopyruvate decarboxylase
VTSGDAVGELLRGLTGAEVVVAANGYVSRHAFARDPEAPNRFFMIGSMGMASSIALGLALARPGLPVVVLDGDGNLLMNCGGLAQVGYHRPANWLHVVLDNGRYQSTGGQETISGGLDLCGLALAAGYRGAALVRSPAALRRAVFRRRRGGPWMLVVKVREGGEPPPGRVGPAPEEITARLRRWLRAQPH